jgi:hypothetical protein
MEIKILLMAILVLAGLAIWLLPKLELVRRLTLSERTYSVIHLIGIICGLGGIVLSFAFPDSILKAHYFELIMIPVFAAYAVYPAIVARARKLREWYDEKQVFDQARAASFAMVVTTVEMILVYALYREGALSGLVWFPLYVFSMVASYSACTLLLFRKG